MSLTPDMQGLIPAEDLSISHFGCYAPSRLLPQLLLFLKCSALPSLEDTITLPMGLHADCSSFFRQSYLPLIQSCFVLSWSSCLSSDSELALRSHVMWPRIWSLELGSLGSQSPSLLSSCMNGNQCLSLSHCLFSAVDRGLWHRSKLKRFGKDESSSYVDIHNSTFLVLALLLLLSGSRCHLLLTLWVFDTKDMMPLGAAQGQAESHLFSNNCWRKLIVKPNKESQLKMNSKSTPPQLSLARKYVRTCHLTVTRVSRELWIHRYFIVLNSVVLTHPDFSVRIFLNIKKSLKFEFYLWMKPVFSHKMLTSIQSAFRFQLMFVTPLFSGLPCLISKGPW